MIDLWLNAFGKGTGSIGETLPIATMFLLPVLVPIPLAAMILHLKKEGLALVRHNSIVLTSLGCGLVYVLPMSIFGGGLSVLFLFVLFPMITALMLSCLFFALYEVKVRSVADFNRQKLVSLWIYLAIPLTWWTCELWFGPVIRWNALG